MVSGDFVLALGQVKGSGDESSLLCPPSRNVAGTAESNPSSSPHLDPFVKAARPPSQNAADKDLEISSGLDANAAHPPPSGLHISLCVCMPVRVCPSCPIVPCPSSFCSANRSQSSALVFGSYLWRAQRVTGSRVFENWFH